MSSSTPSFARLSSTNYSTWSGDMEAWLKAHALWRIVSGSQPRPGSKPSPPASTRSPSASTSSDKDTTAVPTSAGDDSKLLELQDAWDAKSDKAAGWIWLMLEQDQKTLVDGCKDDPSTMWSMLQTTYRQQKAGSRFNAYDDLLAIRKKEDESLQSLINRVDEAMKLCQSLRTKDFDLASLDKELTSMVLIRALPDEFSHFVSSLLLLDKLDKDTVTRKTTEFCGHCDYWFKNNGGAVRQDRS
ncbi:hypothetical protein NMY22_g8184 [Coprinellus aureogranulatus]|nr:hypothetical protein NMY22_g8184 [Coprinellus aureogranulatus]